MQFTFDESPPFPSDQDGCTDRAGTVGQDNTGRESVCSDLRQACSEKEKRSSCMLVDARPPQRHEPCAEGGPDDHLLDGCSCLATLGFQSP